MTLTQDEAEFLLKEIINREQTRLRHMLKPYMDELIHIGRRKPPEPVNMPDGRVMIYKGPTAEDIGGPYEVPRWLNELSLEDYSLSEALGYYRRKMAPASTEE